MPRPLRFCGLALRHFLGSCYFEFLWSGSMSVFVPTWVLVLASTVSCIFSKSLQLNSKITPLSEIKES